MVKGEKCRRSLAEFIRQGWQVLEPSTPLTWNWHIDAICQHVQIALEDWKKKQADPDYVQRIRNLLVNVPPGTAKSRIVSVFTPAWMWIGCPEWRAIFLSANPRVALRDSVYCRDLVESEWYRETFQITWTLAEDQNAKGLYRNTRGGFRQAIGFTAKIVGDRGDALFIDDPHDPEEIHSDVLRNAVTDRWDSTVANRVNDLRTSVRIGIMQRLHEDDWSGHILREGGWEHLCIPMEYESKRACSTSIGWNDPRTAEGELLFPERFPPKIIAEEKKRLGTFGYAGQHQQSPVPGEGGKFKRGWFRYWEYDQDGSLYRLRLSHGETVVKVKDCRRFATVDLAFSQRQQADFTVISAWAVTTDCDLVLLDVHRDRIPDHELIPSIKRMSDRHNLSYVGIEATQAQVLVVKDARRKGLTVRALDADRDKVTRAIPATVRMEAEQIFLPKAHAVLSDIEHELALFPNGSHDDFVDTLAYACREVLQHGRAPETDDERKAREDEAEQAKRRKQEEWMKPNNPLLWR